MEEAMLKYVFCNYGGVLTVEDVHGNRVGELCGGMTLDKYNKIENRSHPDITEFEGLEHYRRIAAELEQEKAEQDREEEERQRILGFVLPRRARQQSGISPQATQISQVMLENTGKKEASVFLFGAATYQIAKNFGNCPDIVIDQPNKYANLLARTLTQPIPVKSYSIHNIDCVRDLEIISKSPMGGNRKQSINLKNFCSAMAKQNTIAEINQPIVFDGNLEFNFKLKGNSKTIIALYH